MTDAGADEFCDFRTVDHCFDDPRLLGTIAGATCRPILVSWCVLLECRDAYLGFSIIAAVPDASRQPSALPGSRLDPLLVSGGGGSRSIGASDEP